MNPNALAVVMFVVAVPVLGYTSAKLFEFADARLTENAVFPVWLVGTWAIMAVLSIPFIILAVTA